MMSAENKLMVRDTKPGAVTHAAASTRHKVGVGTMGACLGVLMAQSIISTVGSWHEIPTLVLFAFILCGLPHWERTVARDFSKLSKPVRFF